MASVLNRTTKQFISSANTPDYPVEDWIIEPDLSAVIGFDSKYWIITGDIVTLMDQAARDAVDAAELAASRDAIADQMDSIETYEKAFAEVLIDELNNTYATINGILDAIDNANNLASVKDAVVLLADRPTRTLSQLKTALRNKLDG